MADATPTPEAAKSPAAAGGFKAWLPLLLVVLLMPALAYVMTDFVLLPKLQKSLGLEAVSAREGGHAQPADAPGAQPAGAGASQNAKSRAPRIRVPLSKIIVNVQGSLGTRLMCASVTLVGSASDFKARVEDNTDQLRDIAAGVLASKTISDLEKPEARNLIRAELLSQFNAALGNTVQEIYITEMAIQ